MKKLANRFAVCVLASLVVAAVLAATAAAQTKDDDVIRINTELVVIDAQVLDKKTGRIIGSLKPADFELYEDGVRQEITFFSQDKLPLSIVLLFDLTDTVRPVLKPLAAGALTSQARRRSRRHDLCSLCASHSELHHRSKAGSERD